MLNLPPTMIDLLKPFAPCFHRATTWKKAQVLLVGAILTPGKRVRDGDAAGDGLE